MMVGNRLYADALAILEQALFKKMCTYTTRLWAM
jgi:hypothetical protein